MKLYTQYAHLRGELAVLLESRPRDDFVTKDEIRYITNLLEELHARG